VGNCNLIALAETTLLIIYGLTYWSTSFLASHFLNIKSFVLNITLSPFFHFSASFLLLSAYHFISSCAFLSAASDSSWTFFIFSTISVVFSTFSLLLISPLSLVLYHNLPWMEILWLLSILCYLSRSLKVDLIFISLFHFHFRSIFYF